MSEVSLTKMGTIGLAFKRVLIEEITLDGMAVCRDQFGKIMQVTTRVQRAKGLLPKVGERWLVDRSLGMWTFAAILDEQVGAPFDQESSRAQGLFSEGWSQKDGLSWSPKRWAVGANSKGVAVTEGGQGVIRITEGSYATRSMTSRMAGILQSETLVTLTPPTSGEWYSKLGSRAYTPYKSANPEPSHAYYLEVSWANIALIKRTDHVQKSLATAAKPPLAPYRMRFRVVSEATGTRLQARVWSLRSAEPTTWLIDFLDTQVSDAIDNDVSGRGATVLVFVGGSPVGTYVCKWDDLVVTAVGNPPPPTGEFAPASLQAGGVLTGDLSEPELADSAVTTPKIQPAAVTTEKVEDQAVTTPKVADSAVTTPKIANASVTPDKMAFAIVPIGGIVMYGGSAAPSGWLLCNGQSTSGHPELANIVGAAVPDLRDRFIVSTGNLYALGATGGANNVTLTTAQIPSHGHAGGSHTHPLGSHLHGMGSHAHDFSAVTDNQGFHNHILDIVDGTGSTAASHRDRPGRLSEAPFEGVFKGANAGTLGAGGHGHGLAGVTASVDPGDTELTALGNSGANSAFGTGLTGDGAGHENRPPYYALTFIIRAR